MTEQSVNVRKGLCAETKPGPLRYENEFSRGVAPGKYTVYLHLFRNLQ